MTAMEFFGKENIVLIEEKSKRFEFFDRVKGVNNVARITIPKDFNIRIGSRVKCSVEVVQQ